MSLTFKVTAHHHFEYAGGATRHHLDRPMSVEVQIEVETQELAAEIAATFPTSCKMRSGPVYRCDAPVRGYVSCRVILTADRVNGGRNEAGIKRYRSVRRAIAKLGHTAVWVADRADNAYATEDAFEAAIA